MPVTHLAPTALVQEAVVFGTPAAPRPHAGSEGSREAPAGPHPAGAASSAFDPELMLWTLAVIAASGRAMYEAMVRPLSEAEREALWQEYVRFGGRLRLCGGA